MNREKPNNYAKYSGMAFQLLSAILLGAFGGQWIDRKMGNSKPIATIIGSLLGISTGLYLSLKDFIKPPSDSEQ